MTPAGKKPWVQFYEDKNSSDWQELVALRVREQVRIMPVTGDDIDLPLSGRIMVTLRFNLVKPVSYSKKVVHHTKKPDLDNLTKGVLDGLVKGRLLTDDSLITDLVLSKRYVEDGHPEGVEVDLTATPD